MANNRGRGNGWRWWQGGMAQLTSCTAVGLVRVCLRFLGQVGQHQQSRMGNICTRLLVSGPNGRCAWPLPPLCRDPFYDDMFGYGGGGAYSSDEDEVGYGYVYGGGHEDCCMM